LISLKPVWAELETMLLAQWTDIADGYQSLQASRLNWRDALASGDLVAPFVVLRPLKMTPYEELAISEHYYRLPVEIYYVRSETLSTAEKLVYDRVMQPVEEKCSALAHYIDHTSFTTFQIVDECEVDCSDQNEANMSLTEGTGAPYVAGVVTAYLILSELVGS
jgi:hypothetical protein